MKKVLTSGACSRVGNGAACRRYQHVRPPSFVLNGVESRRDLRPLVSHLPSSSPFPHPAEQDTATLFAPVAAGIPSAAKANHVIRPGCP